MTPASTGKIFHVAVVTTVGTRPQNYLSAHRSLLLGMLLGTFQREGIYSSTLPALHTCSLLFPSRSSQRPQKLDNAYRDPGSQEHGSLDETILETIRLCLACTNQGTGREACGSDSAQGPEARPRIMASLHSEQAQMALPCFKAAPTLIFLFP